MEQRALLPDLVEKIRTGVNSTLEYVMKNMTWSNRDLTIDPAFSVVDARRRLDHIRSEAVRLTKIKKIDPIPYSDSSDSGRDYWRDPKMREFYEQYYKNLSRNGTNYSEWLRPLPTHQVRLVGVALKEFQLLQL
eukprot:g13082.t1